MRVAIFTDNDFGKVNGVTTSLRAVLRYAPDDIRPRVYTASDFGDDRPDYFAVASVGMGVPFYSGMRIYVPRFRRFLRQVRRDGIDLIHFTTPGPVGLAALFVAWRTGLRMVGSFHTDLATYTARLSGSARLGALMRQYLRWPYGKCERIFVPSMDTRQLLIDGRINASLIELWRRGVDTQLFSPEKRSGALREHWRVCDRRPAAIYVGRISAEKGLTNLPAIQSALHRRGAEHRLVLVGDGPLRRALQEQLPDAVFMGALTPSGVATALASADAFLFPSDTDSAGNVVLEAQASGLPVVISSGGGPKEYVQPDVTALVCRSGEPESFGHEAAGLLRDARRRRRMGEAARAHALTLRWEEALEPLYRGYREVAALDPAKNGHAAHASKTARRNAAA